MSTASPVRSAQCPNCGGPLEFKLGSSNACICPYCRFSVARRGVAFEAIGKIADLVPTAARFTVGDVGTIDGKRFTVGGRLQLDHGRGPWDEWYVELEHGRWGWLAFAQGRYYVTFPLPAANMPPYERLRPGDTATLTAAGNMQWKIGEVGRSTLISAEGELPLPAEPGEQGRYVDLTGDDGLFATIDYGEQGEPPILYVGREHAPDAVVLTRAAIGPRPTERTEMDRLRCPKCGGPIALHVPDSERATCPSCRALLDCDHGVLSYIRTLDEKRSKLLVPLGSSGKLQGENVTVIGFIERTTTDGYSWDEYLLHGDKGYRWLVEDDNHFMFVREVSPGSVREHVLNVSLHGRSYRRFQRSTAKISYILGELYWKAAIGDSADLADFIAPPYMLSSEHSSGELHWSHCTYLRGDEVWKGLSLPGSAPSPVGVAPAQPSPVSLRYSGIVCAALIGMLCLMGLAVGPSSERIASITLSPAQSSALNASEDSVKYSEPFEIKRGPTTLEVELETTASNQWVSVACALIDEHTNQVREFYAGAEYYFGSSGGESWSEGDRDDSAYLGRVTAGTYVLRFDPKYGDAGAPPNVTAHIHVGQRSPGVFFIAFVLIALPFGIAAIRKAAFEAQRWKNSNLVSSNDDDDDE